MIEFGERLRRVRELRGLTQAELGHKAMIPPSSIAHFENGTRHPSMSSLRRLCAALQTPSDYLIKHDIPENSFNDNIFISQYRHQSTEVKALIREVANVIINSEATS